MSSREMSSREWQPVSRRWCLARLGTSAAGVVGVVGTAACGAGGAGRDAQPNPARQPVSVVYYNSLVATHPETVALMK